MRRYELMLILVVVAIICLLVMVFGIKIGPITFVNSYSKVMTSSNEKNNLLNELEYKKKVEYVEQKSELDKYIKEYNIKKSEYDMLVNSNSIPKINTYDANEIWDLVEEYAKEQNIVLKVDIQKSNETVSISNEYTMCDFKFDITGQYINITDFLYSMEKDNKLGFEISNFTMEKNDNKLKANFVVKNIPIKNDTL